MDPWLNSMVPLLSDPDPDLRTSAARVIGALKPAEPEIIAALGRALQEPDPRVRAACLGAIASIGGTDAFEPVAALLDENGEIGRRAVDALTAMGPGVLGRLKRRLASSSPLASRRILAVATHLGGADGIGLLLKAIEAGHAQQVLELGERLAQELANTKGRDRTRLVGELEKFLDSPAARGAADAAVAAVDLLARVLGSGASSKLIDFAASKRAPQVRRRALEALARESADVRIGPEEVTRVLGLLHDRDYTNVVAPAMAVLERVTLTATSAPALFGLLRSDDPALRRFAIAALGQLDTPKSAEALLEVLRGDNPDLSKRAALSLAKLSCAVGPTVTALASAPDSQTAWVLARILMPRSHHLKPEQAAELAKAAAKWLEPGDPRAEAVVAVLRGRHLDALEEAGLPRIRKLKRDRKPGEILNLLRPLVREEATTPTEVRYEIALAEISRGSKNVVREARLNHPGLAALEPLVQDTTFDLLARLRREKKYLMPEDYYLVGCHFSERPFADRIFGGEILRWLIKTFPEDLAAQGAANKLLMEGFAPPAPPKSSPKPRATAKRIPKAKTKAPARKKPVRHK